mmetsp:Transcript_129965/g.229695  ORF Transcript_129965/g.229695 Transcript_129965/m.229695 type:complete len:177 (-) Transcript_129965:2-532(-)
MMFFVIFGAVEYSTEDGLTISVMPGSWACEAALWVNRPRLMSPFTASVNGCDMITLSTVDFIRTAQQFTGSFSELSMYAEHFVSVFNDHTGECKEEDILFNDPMTIEYIVGLSMPNSNFLGNSMKKNSMMRALFSNGSVIIPKNRVMDSTSSFGTASVVDRESIEFQPRSASAMTM